MRPPKILSWIVLVTMAPQLTGCSTTTTLTPQSLRGYPATADQSRVLMVTTRDRSYVKLRGVWVDSVTVYGTSANAAQVDAVPVEIPLEEVTRIEESRFNIGKTALLLLAFAGAMAVYIDHQSWRWTLGGY
ncbi:MAG: hypothetical protein ACWGSD_08440 [Thermodesulfobacteriota bacterium]